MVKKLSSRAQQGISFLKERFTCKAVQRASGFSFFEILVSMLLFMVALSAFAMVFPSGYHLNSKTFRHNKGVDLAGAILQEVASKPFYSPPGSATGDSLFNLQSWNGIGEGSSQWTPIALATFIAHNPGLQRTYQYTLAPAGAGIQQGLIVTFLAPGGHPELLTDNPLVFISVNLSWQEQEKNIGEGARPRILTLTSYATYNR